MACPNQHEAIMEGLIACEQCKHCFMVEVFSGQRFQCPECRTWFMMFLSDFRPSNMVAGEAPTAEITITPTQEECDHGNEDPVGKSKRDT